MYCKMLLNSPPPFFSIYLKKKRRKCLTCGVLSGFWRIGRLMNLMGIALCYNILHRFALIQ